VENGDLSIGVVHLNHKCAEEGLAKENAIRGVIGGRVGLVVSLVDSKNTDLGTILICVRFKVVFSGNRVVVGVDLNLDIGHNINHGVAVGVFGVAEAMSLAVVAFVSVVELTNN